MSDTSDDTTPPSVRLARREFRLFTGTSSGPRLRVVSTVRLYRQAATREITREDQVLEVGCSTGETTRLLATTGATVLAVDTAEELCVSTAERLKAHENVSVRHVDARNVPSLVKLMPRPDVVLIDVGGSAQLNTVAFVVRQCLKAFEPRLMVVRNTELAALACLIESVECPLEEDWPFEPMNTGDESQMRLEHLLAVSRSETAASRVFAARRLRLYDDPRAHKRLEELAVDPQPRVQRVARAVLDDIERQKAQ